MKKIVHILLLLFVQEALISQDIDAERMMNRTHRQSNYRKALRKPLETKLLRIKNYSDSIFPNDLVLNFRNIVSLEINGLDDSVKAPLPALPKLRIDPVRLKQLTELRCLSINGFDLSLFPEELCTLGQLQGLALDECSIKALPPCISSLSELTYLRLRINELKGLPEEFGELPKLENLDVGNNKLVSVPVPVSRLRALKELTLSNVESDRIISPLAGRSVGIYINQVDLLGSYETVRLMLASGHLQRFSADTGFCNDLWLFIGKLRSDHLMSPAVRIGNSGCR